jgi:hypothetical protein
MGGVPLPAGYHSVNPYIVVDDAERLVHFLVEVFGAVEQGRALRPDGRIDHGDVRIGDSLVMLGEASDQYPARPCVHFVYVRMWTPPTGPRWRPELPRSWSPPSSAGATVPVASSTRSTTAGGSQPICESSPRPTTFRYEPDARRRPGRLQTDLACSRWMPRRSSRLLRDPEGSSG